MNDFLSPCRPLAQRATARVSRGMRRQLVRAAESAVKAMRGVDELHPIHAVYAAAQNQISALAEELSCYVDLDPLAEMLEEAESTYWPSGPPTSPLTLSYFTCWSLFDATTGPERETVGTILMDIGPIVELEAGLLHLLRNLQESRMGLHAVEAMEDGVAVLKDLGNGATCRALVPAGHRGQPGELWYARVLPPPVEGEELHLVFTTPYVLAHPGLKEWKAYLRRATSASNPYEAHLKYGPEPTYWPEFVFQGYANHRHEAIFLVGLPDRPETLPHSDAYGGGPGSPEMAALRKALVSAPLSSG